MEVQHIDVTPEKNQAQKPNVWRCTIKSSCLTLTPAICSLKHSTMDDSLFTLLYLAFLTAVMFFLVAMILTTDHINPSIEKLFVLARREVADKWAVRIEIHWKSIARFFNRNDIPYIHGMTKDGKKIHVIFRVFSLASRSTSNFTYIHITRRLGWTCSRNHFYLNTH